MLSGDDLANRHVTSLVDLNDGTIPSLRIAPFFSRNSALIVNIRGIGVLSDGNQPARDQGVGVYVNGVYLGRAQGLGTALFDIDSLEVLKGPQGTLFGRNTEGGAVNITTRKPTGEFHANVIGGIGNFGSYKTEAHVDLPTVAGIALKIDGVVSHRDPLVRNPLSGALGFNQYDKRGLRVEALWRPTSDFSADYAFDTSYDASTSNYLQLFAKGTNVQAALGTIQPTRAEVANVGVPEQPSVGKVRGHELTLAYTPSRDLTVKSITSYRSLTQSQYDNGAASTTMSNASGVFTGVAFSRYSLAQFRQKPVQPGVPGDRRHRPAQVCTGRALLPRERPGQRAGFQHQSVHRRRGKRLHRPVAGLRRAEDRSRQPCQHDERGGLRPGHLHAGVAR